MGKYTYTASLVDESINILQRADQELSGTNAAVLNAVNTILNARGAERLGFDFADILDLTDYARDDIAAITKEILDKQEEIEEYENAPWWKKLFASLGLAILKLIEGHAQSIEYIFDFAVSLAGFIGGLFNSEFKASCQEFVEIEHVDNWFTQQYIGEDGLFKWFNSNSVFSYNSTAANIIEFGGCLAQSLLTLSTNPIGGAASLYKSFENLIDNSNINTITTATPIINAKLKEIFEIEIMDEPEVTDSGDGETDIVDADDGGYPVPTDDTDGDGGGKFEGTTDSSDGEGTSVGSGGGTQALYGPPPVNPFDGTEQGTSTAEEPTQVLYGPPPTTDDDLVFVEDDSVVNPQQVLYGPPPVDPEDTTGTSVLDSHGSTTGVSIPKASSTDEITKKSAGAFGDLIGGTSSTPVSSKPLSSKDNQGEGTMSTPLASGVIAAGVAGWGTKTYMDKKKSSDKDDDEIQAEEWNEDPDELSVDYAVGIKKDAEADYLSPEDELAFTE